MNIEERVILIRIPRLYRPTMRKDQLYDATRKWWVLNPDRDPDYAFSVVGGVVKAVYKIAGWEQPPVQERVGRLERRWAFRGVVDPEREGRYVGTDVTEYFPRGAANPVRYVNC
jgi:hypothetical protein